MLHAVLRRRRWKHRLLKLHPKLQVTGGKTLPADTAMRSLSTAIKYGQLALMALLVAGKPLLGAVGVGLPGWWPTELVHTAPYAAAVYVFGAQAIELPLHTGDFEVAYNGKEVWSARQRGRLPSWPELIAGLEAVGLPQVANADDAAQFPAGWRDAEL